MKLALLLILLVGLILMNNQVKASCSSYDPDPLYEFYNTSTCKQRRGGLVVRIPNKDDRVDLDRKCSSLIMVARRANFTFPWRNNVWTRWHCPRMVGCSLDSRGAGVGIYRGERCRGKTKFVRLDTVSSDIYCIDRPGGGYIILRCVDHDF